MRARRVGEIVDVVAAALDGDPHRVVDAVATDSRDMPGGAPLFVALRGEHGDGHDHAAAAVRAGAVGVLCERATRGLDELDVPILRVADTWAALRVLAADERRRSGARAVAITGSVGKTTVKDLCAAAVGAGLRVHAARGSFNNELGVPLTVLGMRDDTEVVVSEIGARHVGDIAALAPIVAPDVAVVSAVAGVHLEVFKTIDAVAEAKSELVRALGPDGVAVLNVADPRVAAMQRLAPDVLRVADDDATADVTATNVRLDALGRPRATAHTPWGSVPLELPVTGRHQVTNALLALAVAGRLGVELHAAAAALVDATVSPWRGAVTTIGGITVLDDAYNANPTSVAAALDTLASIHVAGTRWAVLGEMAEIGPTAADEHEAIGRRCGELGIEHVVAVGAGARPVAVGARTAGVHDIDEVADAAAAAALLAARAVEGDAVLVKASRVAGLELVVPGLRGEDVA